MMAFSGVRMSWLTVEKKYSFALAASRSRRAIVEYTENMMASARTTSAIWMKLSRVSASSISSRWLER